MAQLVLGAGEAAKIMPHITICGGCVPRLKIDITQFFRDKKIRRNLISPLPWFCDTG